MRMGWAQVDDAAAGLALALEGLSRLKIAEFLDLLGNNPPPCASDMGSAHGRDTSPVLSDAERFR